MAFVLKDAPWQVAKREIAVRRDRKEAHASPSMQITQNSALPGGVHSTRPCHRLYKRHSSILHPPRTQAKVQNFFGKLFQKDDGDVTKKENQPQAPLPLRLFPPFQVINKNSDYSLRLYELFPVVTMEYENRAE
eukprot:scaffold46758_cov18-Tisochrysis_lutea.AAC.1